MELKLKSILIKNFKGINHFTCDFEKNTQIIGKNELGKTTVFDAFAWLFFDKDSKGKKAFSIKPLDKHNNEINNLDVEVSSIFEVDDKEYSFKKVFKEKWAKQRGQHDKVFSGHTTDYFIDDVPVKQKEYKEKVGEILDEDIFKITTDPMAFPSLHWEKQRSILNELVGEIDESSIMNENIKRILGDKLTDDIKKSLRSKKKAINERLDEIPARIDELKNSLTELEKPEHEEESIQSKIKELEEKKITGSDDYKKELSKVELKIQENIDTAKKEDSKKESEFYSDKVKIEDKLSDVKREKSKLNFEYDNTVSKNGQINFQISSLKERQNELREEFTKAKAQKFDGDTICPTCKQALPETDLQEMVKSFQAGIKAGIESINKEGKSLSEKIKTLENGLLALPEKPNNEMYDSKIQTLTNEIANYGLFVAQDYENIECNKDLKIRRNDLIALINNEKDLMLEKNKEIDEAIKEQKELLQLVYKYHASVESQEKTKSRIKELEEEQRKLSGEFAEIEKDLFSIEDYIKARVELIEGKVNSIFDLIRFKLFKQNINGGIEDTCEITVNGVPFNTGLNTGTCINAGLEMCKKLQEFHNISVPIFIDNSESVTKFIDLDCQTIKLIHNPEVSTLTVKGE